MRRSLMHSMFSTFAGISGSPPDQMIPNRSTSADRLPFFNGGVKVDDLGNATDSKTAQQPCAAAADHEVPAAFARPTSALGPMGDRRFGIRREASRRRASCRTRPWSGLDPTRPD